SAPFTWSPSTASRANRKSPRSSASRTAGQRSPPRCSTRPWRFATLSSNPAWSTARPKATTSSRNCWPRLSQRLSNDVFDDLAAHFGQPLLAAQVHVAQRVLIQAHLVQQGGVQIAEMHRLFRGLQPNAVGGAVNGAAFESAARHPHRKP